MNNIVQRILWKIAGAETDILVKCKTDYNRYAAIGATILMTSFIAFLAGTAAAWYFTQSSETPHGNIWMALPFGCVWSLLIFCIDRSLVITLKKDPTKAHQNFWVPLLSRAFLALIIAFMVSIPLELVIFEDYIKENEQDYLAHQEFILGQQLRRNSGEDEAIQRVDSATTIVNSLDRESNALSTEIQQLQAKINQLEREKSNPNSSAYNSAKSRYNSAQSAYNQAQSNYNRERSREHPSQSSLNSYQSQMNTQRQNMNSARRAMNTAAEEWRHQKQSEIDALVSQRNTKQNDKDRKDNLLEQTVTNQNIDRTAAANAAQERRELERLKREQSEKGNHFIRNFQILEYAVKKTDKDGNLTDTTQLSFLWLIRLLFFVLEILPTVVKIVTPLGSYDRMVYAEEENVKKYLNSDEYANRLKHMHDMEIEAKEEQLKQQHDIEAQMKDELLKDLKEAQLDVARKAIAEWKKKELDKLDNGSKESKTVTPGSTTTLPSPHYPIPPTPPAI